MTKKRGQPAMNEVVSGLASLAAVGVACVALTVIAVPTFVGTRRAVRAVTRAMRLHIRASQRRDEQSNPHKTTLEAATAQPVAAVAVAVRAPRTAQEAATTLEGLRSATADTITPLPNGAFRHEMTAPAEPMPGTPGSMPALTPLERAVWQCHERRGVPRVVQAAWDEWSERGEGPHELVPGRYPLLGGLLSQQQVEELMARRGDETWERSAVTGAGPMDPVSNGWN